VPGLDISLVRACLGLSLVIKQVADRLSDRMLDHLILSKNKIK
jgi:hypothetical protein